MLNIWNLPKGATIRVVQTFRDYAGTEYVEGTILHFTHRNYLPYHAGHTVYFRESTMYLCDNDETGAFAENRGGEFFELVEQSE